MPTSLENALRRNNDPRRGTDAGQQSQHGVFRHGDAAGGGREICPGEVKENSTPATGDARLGVVIDFNDEVVEVVVPRQPIAGLSAVEPDGAVVVPVSGVFRPGVFGTNRANR